MAQCNPQLPDWQHEVPAAAQVEAEPHEGSLPDPLAIPPITDIILCVSSDAQAGQIIFFEIFCMISSSNTWLHVLHLYS